MRPFNNNLMIDPHVEKTEEENNEIIWTKSREKTVHIKARLLKYSETSSMKHIWKKSIQNIIFVNSSFMFEIEENGRTYYFVPESAVVAGYYSKNNKKNNYESQLHS